MSIDLPHLATNGGDEHASLPPVPGGWQRRCVDIGWTTLTLTVPATPDALLDLPEVQEANRRDDAMPYWATLWPAAEVMARLLCRAQWPVGTNVLEVGCGLGLVGIAGLARGWCVHLSDNDDCALAAARHNSALNGFPGAKISRLDWRQPWTERFPVILACDVLYETRNHNPVLDLIERMLMPGGCCWIGDPGRTPIVAFFEAARERGFKLTLRDRDGQPCGFPVRGQFQLLELMPPPDTI